MAKTVDLVVRYRAGHQYDERWEESDIFCPSCGKRAVWIDQGEGDYYQGAEHLCKECGCSFTMPSCSTEIDAVNEQRLQAIRGRGGR